MSPAVSILTPTYNHTPFLRDCIQSVLAQTFESWELIVLDDGSTDGTGDLVRAFADPRIRYFPQEHIGILRLAETYNRGLRHCRAPLIAILEGDDYWPPDKLATLVPAFSDPEIVLAYGITEVVGDGRGTFGLTIPSSALQTYIPDALANTPVGSAALAMLDYRALTFTYPCSVLLRRDVLDRIGGFQARAGLPLTDYPTFLRISIEGRFHFEPRTTGYWRVHSAGATVQKMDEILAAVHEEAIRFRAGHADRLDAPPERWRRIDRRWRTVLGGLAMRRARRLLLQSRFAEARTSLREAILSAEWRTRAIALIGWAVSFAGASVEWAYRGTGRIWFALSPEGRVEVVFPPGSTNP